LKYASELNKDIDELNHWSNGKIQKNPDDSYKTLYGEPQSPAMMKAASVLSMRKMNIRGRLRA
jgi:hypothetical protein